MKLSITQMKFRHRLSALLQLDLHSRLNIWLQGIRQRQPRDSTRTLWLLGFGASYIRDLTVYICILYDFCVVKWQRYTVLEMVSWKTWAHFLCMDDSRYQPVSNIVSHYLNQSEILSSLQYKPHQIPKFKCFLPRLAVVFVQCIEVRC